MELLNVTICSGTFLVWRQKSLSPGKPMVGYPRGISAVFLLIQQMWLWMTWTHHLPKPQNATILYLKGTPDFRQYSHSPGWEEWMSSQGKTSNPQSHSQHGQRAARALGVTGDSKGGAPGFLDIPPKVLLKNSNPGQDSRRRVLTWRRVSAQCSGM
jgi:hypothetical protein